MASQSELARLYGESDIFINPTREDNYPTTCLEAVACGTPVICFDNGGTAETVFDNCGLAIEPTNEALLEAILTFPLHRVALDEKNRYRLSREKQIHDYVSLYAKMMEERDEQ